MWDLFKKQTTIIYFPRPILLWTAELTSKCSKLKWNEWFQGSHFYGLKTIENCCFLHNIDLQFQRNFNFTCKRQRKTNCDIILIINRVISMVFTRGGSRSFLRRGCKLRSGVTDWWCKQILKANMKKAFDQAVTSCELLKIHIIHICIFCRIPVLLENGRSFQVGGGVCTLPLDPILFTLINQEIFSTNSWRGNVWRSVWSMCMYNM